MKHISKLAAACLVLCPLMSATAKKAAAPDISHGTVKIIKTYITPDYNLPWKMKAVVRPYPRTGLP